MLESPLSGEFCAYDAEQGLHTRADCDDSCMWVTQQEGPTAKTLLRSATSDRVVLEAEPVEPAPTDAPSAQELEETFGPGAAQVVRRGESYLLRYQGGAVGGGREPCWRALEGPIRLPSAYLEDMERQGYVRPPPLHPTNPVYPPPAEGPPHASHAWRFPAANRHPQPSPHPPLLTY